MLCICDTLAATYLTTSLSYTWSGRIIVRCIICTHEAQRLGHAQCITNMQQFIMLYGEEDKHKVTLARVYKNLLTYTVPLRPCVILPQECNNYIPGALIYYSKAHLLLLARIIHYAFMQLHYSCINMFSVFKTLWTPWGSA